MSLNFQIFSGITGPIYLDTITIPIHKSECPSDYLVV